MNNINTQKWESLDNININTNTNNMNNIRDNTYNININDNINNNNRVYEPMRNRQSSRSVYDDKNSEDNKSFKSGATGRPLGNVDNLDFLKL